jgi:hypothetical protein
VDARHFCQPGKKLLMIGDLIPYLAQRRVWLVNEQQRHPAILDIGLYLDDWP